jgi:hypothetical protein
MAIGIVPTPECLVVIRQMILTVCGLKLCYGLKLELLKNNGDTKLKKCSKFTTTVKEYIPMTAIHIWCTRPSDSAIKIRDALRADGIKAYKSKAAPSYATTSRFLHRVNPGDLWINWGPPPSFAIDSIVEYRNRSSPDFFPVVCLNTTHYNKRDQLLVLAQAGVLCPEVYDNPGDGRLGRSLKHQGGKDLVAGTGRDYWTQKIELHHEVRVHVFGDKSIHTGVKVRQPGFPNPHPWIRSHEQGWAIDYSLAKSVKRDRRDMAKKAITALGLDFGAVDIGISSTGIPVVLEVNTAPGLDSGTSTAVYVEQFKRLVG